MTRNLLGLAVVIVAILMVVVLAPFGAGRYQIAEIRQQFLVRLDTRTGAMKLYVLGRGRQADQLELQDVRLFEIGVGR